jgi:AcrR family transcriptional regulator
MAVGASMNVREGSRRSVASRAVDRAIEGRRAAYEQEITRLVDASFKLIRDTGNLEPRVSEIVAEAGLSNQAFYKHFRSKDELLLAVLDESSHILKDYLEHKVAKAKSAEQKIRSWIDGMLAQVLNEEAAHATRPFALSRTRLSELFPEEVMNSERQLTAVLQEVIQEAIQSGDFPDADADRDSEIIHNLVLGWMERKLSGATPPKQAEVNHLIEFVIFGLKRGS